MLGAGCDFATLLVGWPSSLAILSAFPLPRGAHSSLFSAWQLSSPLPPALAFPFFSYDEEFI